MKNKRLYKYCLLSVIDILIALLLVYTSLAILNKIFNYLYIHTESEVVNYLWYLWRKFKYEIFGQNNFNIIIVLITFFIFYLLITYRKNKGLVAIIEETEIMANGDLDRVIQVNAEGDIKNLAENINNISKQLKDITVAERNAQKTKNDLITNVSHDLRTPLTSIMGYLELIDNDQYKDEVALRYYVNIAYEKSKGLNLLIKDLFELTKMQNNTINLEKVDINLVELLGQVVAYFEYQFKSANMESRINFSKDKLIVNADAGKLVRAFENLLSNAIKYGKDGYYVDVVTKLEENMAVIQIINYGQSIPIVDLPYIFDRFYRVEKSRNNKIGGSGLGLAITKNIIELHQGTISAYSDNDSTIFEVKLLAK
ncbi:two-component sensor histidine kinase [Clostridium botulinum]|uniref:histidine kinase n=1 Tax=Clostridium botulinum TaxID=1491 RepID=A0ABC8D090_CLOBO|nr:HAMP domain-containing sensor histidine kinase [Clostridium botulinum]AVQ39749.1 two-component sensor histidine kinase [Clostridium botulinum]